MHPKFKRYANSLIKVLVFVFLSWTIYQQVFRNQSWDTVKQYYARNIDQESVLLLFIVFGLMFVNWFLESWKWQIIIRPLQNISLWQSHKAIFSGITLSIFTPNRIGEYGGRIFYLNPINRIKGVFATLIGSYANILSVILFGVAGVYYQLTFVSERFNIPSSWIITLAGFGLLVAGILYYNFKHVPKLANRRWFKSRARNILGIYTKYPVQILNQILALSIIRYLVFATQYILLLNFFGLSLDWFVGMSKIALIYLAQTIIPSIAVAELGIRGNVALFFLNDVVTNEEIKIGIVSATFTLWLINLIIPAIFGAIFILRLRFFKNK